MTTIGARPDAMHARYLSLTTLDAGTSAPILSGTNPVGDAILTTGFGRLAASMTPVLPVRVCGIEVREILHRFDADARVPTPERGVTSANRTGEPLGELSMRWLVAPDGFEATASALPPETEFDPSRSQRFVMHEGVVRLRDRTASGVRFFGAGRTYVETVYGIQRLLFAGAAVVVEGLGSLRGVRGTITVAGEIGSPSSVSMTVSGRFDDDGPFEYAERVSPLIDCSGEGPDATVLTLVGESDGGPASEPGVERLRATRIANDLANASRPRSVFQIGHPMGFASGPIRFDPSDRRCAIQLIDGQREIAFADDTGQLVATIVADALEGTAFPDPHAGEHASRVIAYGPLVGGTGALAGAGGVLTLDSTVTRDGAAVTLYTLWLVDTRGRFRAPGDRVLLATDTATSADEFQFVDSSAMSMLPSDIAILARVERAVADGGALFEWGRQKDRLADYAERFDVVREGAANDEAFGFFDTAPIAGETLPVMGVGQDVFFDRQKVGDAAGHEAIRAQLREFALRYFLRVSNVREVDAVPAGVPASPSALQRAIGWLPDQDRSMAAGFQQVYYKLAATGQIGKFPRSERATIVDVRDIGLRFDWIVLKVDMVSLELPIAPFGTAAPAVRVPVKQSAYLVIGPAMVTERDSPSPGVLAEYGFGYAFVPHAPDEPGMLAYGPGHLRAALQTIHFRMLTDGEIRARTLFVIDRPDRIATVDVDPIGWSVQLADRLTFRMASRFLRPVLDVTDRLPLRADRFDPVTAYIWMVNTLTGGLADRQLGISKAALEKRMLIQQLTQHHEMLNRSLVVWRMVPDWTNHDQLPDYCRRGLAS